MADPTASPTPEVGSVVQMREWIGVLDEVDNERGTGTVRWGHPGGPFGSARTLDHPLIDLHVRHDLVACDGPGVWTYYR